MDASQLSGNAIVFVEPETRQGRAITELYLRDGIFYAVLRQWPPDHLLIGWTNQSLATFFALDETLARAAIRKTMPRALPPGQQDRPLS
mgnify:CR=1 FL=1